MTRLLLMRHGNTFEEGQIPVQVGARTDLPLTAQGRLQAERMAKYLMAKEMRPKAIYAGPLKRQGESAEILAKYFGLAVRENLALTEIDYGLWEGATAEEIRDRWPKEHAEWTQEAKWQSHIFQGSYEGHFQNLQKWLSELQCTFQNEMVIAVTSNGLLRFLKNEKVKTGHFCELYLLQKSVQIGKWNQDPICE